MQVIPLSMKPTNRRRFSRILFDAPCELHQGERQWRTEVLDISLKGILLKRPDDWSADLKGPFEVVIHLADQGVAIVMAVQLKHAEATHLGYVCQYIDLESASHLKRLVELNLGDPKLLSRELMALGQED